MTGRLRSELHPSEVDSKSQLAETSTNFASARCLFALREVSSLWAGPRGSLKLPSNDTGSAGENRKAAGADLFVRQGRARLPEIIHSLHGGGASTGV